MFCSWFFCLYYLEGLRPHWAGLLWNPTAWWCCLCSCASSSLDPLSAFPHLGLSCSSQSYCLCLGLLTPQAMLALSPRSLLCSHNGKRFAVSGVLLRSARILARYHRVRREFIALERVGTSALSCWFVCSPYWCYSPVFFCNSLRQANGPQEN